MTLEEVKVQQSLGLAVFCNHCNKLISSKDIQDYETNGITLNSNGAVICINCYTIGMEIAFVQRALGI